MKKNNRWDSMKSNKDRVLINIFLESVGAKVYFSVPEINRNETGWYILQLLLNVFSIFRTDGREF